MTPKYKRRQIVACRPSGENNEAWFYVRDGSILVAVRGVPAHAIITRRQLEAALKAMRPLRKRKGRA